jgi:hypothetical protein
VVATLIRQTTNNNQKTTRTMKKTLILMLGLVASTASFAATTTDNTPVQQPGDVFVQSANEKVQIYVAPQATNATIKLLDEDGHTLFTKTSNAQNGIREKLDLSQLEPGTYRLTIGKGSETIEKIIVIENVPAQKQVSLKV